MIPLDVHSNSAILPKLLTEKTGIEKFGEDTVVLYDAFVHADGRNALKNLTANHKYERAREIKRYRDGILTRTEIRRYRMLRFYNMLRMKQIFFSFRKFPGGIKKLFEKFDLPQILNTS